ncbi:MAG: hypothetical protein U9O78_02215 [Patescibacteria group bacterium]|nr:hypothetical protein [Patescibacteria group bacterium]
MTDISPTQQKHHQAEQLREDNKPYQALELYQQVINELMQAHQFKKLAGPLQGMSLTYKHLFYRTNNQCFLIIANSLVDASLKLADKFRAQFRLTVGHSLKGDIYLAQAKPKLAVESFQLLNELHQSNDSLKGRYLYHLGSAQYQAGDKNQGKKNMVDGLKLIQQPQENQDKYDEKTTDTWLSGAYMTLAKNLKDDKPSLAREYLNQAREIIDRSQLVVRKEQLDELAKLFE